MEKDVCQTPPELEYSLLSILLLHNYQLVKPAPPHSVFHVSFLHGLIFSPVKDPLEVRGPPALFMVEPSLVSFHMKCLLSPYP